MAFMLNVLSASFVSWSILTVVHGGTFYWVDQIPATDADDMAAVVVPVLLLLFAWNLGGTDPGKWMMGLGVVDSTTGNSPSVGQCCLRMLGYWMGFATLGIGFLWSAFDKRKQGLHDKLGKTMVVRRTR